MTELNNTSIDNDTVPEDTALNSTALESTASQNQPTPSTTSTRNWFLYLPPEIRLIIYSYVVRLPYPVWYSLPITQRRSQTTGIGNIIFASRVIRRESLDVFYRENTFYAPGFPLLPSRRIADRIQNLIITESVWCFHQEIRDTLISLIPIYTDPAIIRGTFTVNFERRFTFRIFRLNYFLRALGRFTNFRTVRIYIIDDIMTHHVQSVVPLYDHVENTLRSVLGPVEPRTPESGLTFFPQRFLNAQPRREDIDWMDRLEGIRFDWNEEETNSYADESGPLMQNSSSEG